MSDRLLLAFDIHCKKIQEDEFAMLDKKRQELANLFRAHTATLQQMVQNLDPTAVRDLEWEMRERHASERAELYSRIRAFKGAREGLSPPHS